MQKDDKLRVVILIFLVLGTWLIMRLERVHAQGIKFALSEVEALKLENLKLKVQLLQAKTVELNQQWQAQNLELDRFVDTVLKAHGNPKGVTFNKDTYGFEVKEEGNPSIPPSKNVP